MKRRDFVMFGGDLAQLGNKPELDHGAEFLSALNYDVKMVMGEHDYYLDLGEYWSELFGPQHYSFDHKGVHFVVLNSILTFDEWTFNRWESGERRMNEMAGLDNPNGSPFMVGEKKIYKGWNFWTDDAEQVQELLKPSYKVNVIYGHVHQIQYNQIGNIAFNSVMATAWPWPYPQSYAQAKSHLPILTVPMLTLPINGTDPFDERDATGWQFMNVNSGRVDLAYKLYANENRPNRNTPQTRLSI